MRWEQQIRELWSEVRRISIDETGFEVVDKGFWLRDDKLAPRIIRPSNAATRDLLSDDM